MVLCLSFITVIPTALKGLLEVQWPNGNCTGLIDRFWFKPLPRPLCCALGQRHLSLQPRCIYAGTLLPHSWGSRIPFNCFMSWKLEINAGLMAAVVSSTLQRLKLSVYVNLFWHSKSPQESTSLKPGRLILVPCGRLKSLAPLGGVGGGWGEHVKIQRGD